MAIGLCCRFVPTRSTANSTLLGVGRDSEARAQQRAAAACRKGLGAERISTVSWLKLACLSGLRMFFSYLV